MTDRTQILYEEALKLSDAEREELIQLLISKAEDDLVSLEVEQAWTEEIERRESAARAGEVEWLPAEKVLHDLRKLADE